MNLFQLTGDALKVARQIEDLADQIEDNPSAIEQMESLLLTEEQAQDALYEKADAYCWVIEKMRATAAARSAAAQRLKDLSTQDQSKANMLEETLIKCLQIVKPNNTKYQLPNHNITSRKSTVVCLKPDLLPEKLPEAYQRKKIEFDKTAIREALKKGEEIEGATLVERRSWSIK